MERKETENILKESEDFTKMRRKIPKNEYLSAFNIEKVSFL